MARNPKRCYVVDKVTGRIVSEHESLSSAAAKLGMNQSVCRQVRNGSLLENRRHTIRLVEDYDPNESFEGKRKGVPIFAVRGNEVRAWCDRRRAASDLCVSLETLSFDISNGVTTSDGWRVFRMPRMGALNKVLGLEER